LIRNQWRFKFLGKSASKMHLSKVHRRTVIRKFRRRARLIYGSYHSRMMSERHFGKSTKPFATLGRLKSPMVARISYVTADQGAVLQKRSSAATRSNGSPAQGVQVMGRSTRSECFVLLTKRSS